MRLKVPLDRDSKKKNLGSDAKILVTLIKEQPLKKKDLIEKAGIVPSTFSRTEPLLLNYKAIKNINDEYCLFNYDENKANMEDLFKTYKSENKNVATLDEIANAMGKPPEVIINEAYAIGKIYNIIITRN